MNNIKIYEDLCSTRKSMNRSKKDSYYELHHIEPKWMGGDDSEDNLVLLTAREHYLAHYLLFLHYRDKQSSAAFHLMNNNINSKYRDSKKYAELREFQSKKWSGENNPAKRIDVRKKISEGITGKKNGMYGRTGKSNPAYGMKHSKEFLEYKSKLHGQKIEYKGVVYNSIRQASKQTGVSRFLIKKNSNTINE